MADLIDLREAAGYSQEGLGLLVGVPRETIGSWENGIHIPNTGRLTPLARALDVSVTDICSALAETIRLSAYEL